eukprot:gnl/MRDRNA2_/MRDRNA2_170320_c0_seq1.p1 gnl/MRDRNA2_/MRDRNA2_170320_c0~~gnl/MRDRNA2_/MRDRNA2_170320_c0_seq1.p1  ORF type:complete len:479 (+),score=64.34 gnl/MRDRNA2_/MRDRNA2_170320_c0_seq1:26-1438(+)
MKDSGVVPDNGTYTALVNACGKSKQPELVSELVQAMKSHGMSHLSMVANVGTLNVTFDVNESKQQPWHRSGEESRTVPKQFSCDEAEYAGLLAQKRHNALQLLMQAVPNITLPLAHTYESERSHFRARAYFDVQETIDSKGIIEFIDVYNLDHSRTHVVRSFPWGLGRIQDLMGKLRDACRECPDLADRLTQASFLSTLSGDSCVTLIYARSLGNQWRILGRWLAARLECPVVGRSFSFHGPDKVCVDRDVVLEKLSVSGKSLYYWQVANSFSQPNPGVAAQMLTWADEMTAMPMYTDMQVGDNQINRTDLLELYCGNGNFAIAIAHNFRRCFATERVPELVSLAKENAKLNSVTNLAVGVATAQDVSTALQTCSKVESLPDLEIGAVSTILVDPPREGLDSLTRKLVTRFDRIVYISCSPETLARDVSTLIDTHHLAHLAIFDQFPYTSHLEMGLVLQRRPSSRKARRT